MKLPIMRWAFLDATIGLENFTLRQLRLTLQRLGNEAATIQVMKGTRLKEPPEIDAQLHAWKPDRIVWCAETGLPYMGLWTENPWNSVPKIDLWFDEPVTPIERFGLDEMMRHTAGQPGFFHGIWDGYWRDEAYARWGVEARAIHLSADEVEYQPRPDDPSGNKSNEPVVFIGMLHSQATIARHLEGLPRGLCALAAAIRARLDAETHPLPEKWHYRDIPCWDRLWRDVEPELSSKEQLVLKSECQHKPQAVWQVRWATWAMAKNAVRVRVLRQVLQVAPLRVYCEQKQLGHANEAEWRTLLGETGPRLQIVDTSNCKGEELPRIHQEGSLHLQATDPQSVRGGIPYRVFQSAASGKALLTDLRPELVACFEPGKEIFGYPSAAEFLPFLETVLADPSRRRDAGIAARQRFEREHTWHHRIRTIESWIAKI
jgi:hypothetical protein